MGSLRTVATVAAVSLLVQGVLWSILSILSILTYSCHFQPKEDMTNNPSFSAMAMYYFSNSGCWSSQPDRTKAGITSSNNLALIISFQFTFNFLISIVSLVLLFVVPRRSSISFLGWLYSFLFLGFAISITDMVTAATFLADKDVVSGSTSSSMAPLSQMLLLISLIAARGYVYWALNVSILLYIFIAATMRLFKACRKIDEEKNSRNGQVNHAYEEDERGLPAHTAVSRWPAVGESLWRYHRNPQRFEDKPREQPLDRETIQRDKSGFGTRQELKQRPSFRDAFNYMEPRRWRQDEGRPEDSRTLPAANRARRDSALTRPNSLQEAILTIKPLRQVRPKLTEMQNRY